MLEVAVATFLFGVAAIALTTLFIAFNSPQNRLLRRVARHYGGEVQRSADTGRLFVTFRRGNAKITYEPVAHRPRANPHALVRMQWDDQRRCEIFPQFSGSRIRLRGLQDIQIGAREFDARYVVTGSDESGIRALITGEVIKVIEELRASNRFSDLYVAFGGGQIVVQKEGQFWRFLPALRFVDLCLRLRKHACMTDRTGIEFTQPEASSGRNELPICQVCGDEITGDCVECSSCKTLHHDDCWEYYGACSTYGCGEPDCVARQLG